MQLMQKDKMGKIVYVCSYASLDTKIGVKLAVGLLGHLKEGLYNIAKQKKTHSVCLYSKL